MKSIKLVQRWTSLYHLVLTVMESGQSLIHLAILIGLYLFIFAVMGMELYGGKFPPSDTNRRNFDSLLQSSLTVFQIFTGDEWDQILLIAVSIESIPTILTVIYFFSCYFIGSVIVLSVFLAILLTNFKKTDPLTNRTFFDEIDINNDAASMISISIRVIRFFIVDIVLQLLLWILLVPYCAIHNCFSKESYSPVEIARQWLSLLSLSSDVKRSSSPILTDGKSIEMIEPSKTDSLTSNSIAMLANEDSCKDLLELPVTDNQSTYTLPKGTLLMIAQRMLKDSNPGGCGCAMHPLFDMCTRNGEKICDCASGAALCDW